jgi:predicted phosphodiesterase
MKLGLLSDAHGNLEAFDLACRVLDDLGADELCFLGDAVGYLPGAAVADRIVADGIDAVRGNHEAMLLSGCQLEADDAYRLAATAAAMTPETREALAGWPVTRTRELASGTAVLLHGSPVDPTFGYVYPDTDLTAFADDPALDGATVFMGNTHRPFLRRCGSTTFVNVGSCGLPRDVGALGAACLFDDSIGEARIVRFDIREATACALDRCGPVHDLVKHVLARTTEHYVGELVP